MISEPKGQTTSILPETLECKNGMKSQASTRLSLISAIIATLLVRIAGRTSFVILGFYLGEHFASAAMVALVLEAFYITELLLSPMIGGLSDHLGRRPFLLWSPVIAVGAVSCFLVASRLYPHPSSQMPHTHLFILLIIILFGRLLEGATTGLNVPATLGYLTDVTVGSERLRMRAVTAFEVVTVGAIGLAIPFAGKISSMLDTWGFLVVIALHMLVMLIIALGVRESVQPQERAETRPSLLAGFSVLQHRRISTFLPAWFSVNALVGAWAVLITIMLAYPKHMAIQRHPDQLLYGGFSKMDASLWVGGFALLFLCGMGIWMLFVTRFRRSTVMLIGLIGLGIIVSALAVINGLGETMRDVMPNQGPQMLLLLILAALGIFLLSGFTPVALMQMSAIAESLSGKRGAVMGLYSVVLAVGQLTGTTFGGLCVDWNGFYGLMQFSLIMGVLSFLSVLYMRYHNDDLLQAPERESHQRA
ncbi:MFS transporter [Ktedonospora formicarum]|uniref:MFS transporter n=1 Tax=Ktedonospora formicarum TaxID=2778364 RepID=A0A8J3HVQ9_9CHLR|nr:MFS transporter [Ktedonospora formicarum]GHO44942.1 MFS transporter [Ktedonospora formicarum]